MIIPIQKSEIALVEQSNIFHGCDFLELVLPDADECVLVRTCFNAIISIVLQRFYQNIASFLDEHYITESMLQSLFELQDLLVLIKKGLIEKLA